MGLCYYFGIGTSLDYEKANLLFGKLIEENLATASELEEANYWLGMSYLMGNGYSKSIEKARDHFLKANIDQDHEAAQLMLNLIGR